MRIEVLADADRAAQRAAEIIATEARATVSSRGRFTLAVSGGRTPLAMLRALSTMDLPWPSVHVLQVDERVAPDNHPDRNLTHLVASLKVGNGPLPHIAAMRVDAPDLAEAAREYELTLAEVAGSPPVLDLIHLGLGSDGHTASLIPGDPALDISAADVAVAGEYQGRRRLTLTYPVLNRARRVIWVVTGEEKASMLVRLCKADPTIPAGRVRQDHAVVIADRAAAG